MSTVESPGLSRVQPPRMVWWSGLILSFVARSGLDAMGSDESRGQDVISVITGVSGRYLVFLYNPYLFT